MANTTATGLGKVYLVGAGPGDPELITVKGLRCVETADVVVHDRLVDERVLSHARNEAELVDAGKSPGDGRSVQADINALLVARAREGKVVVRLKGGDPFVFGRGGEEAEALADAHTPFEVVPGITSAIAAPAYAGIPLTHRKLASSFTVVTGSTTPDKRGAQIDWNKLANAGDTLVVLMGWESLSSIAQALVRGGRSPSTPAALIQWGSEPYQRTVVGTLSNIGEKASSSSLTPPVVAVIGDVVGLSFRLRWFDNRPLSGKRILVTRNRAQAGALSDLLARAGAQPIEVPTIEIRPPESYDALDAALLGLHRYDWALFASSNAVTAVFGRLRALDRDARAFHAVQVAAVGPSTERELGERGVRADFVPDEFVTESIIEGLRQRGIAGQAVLLPRSEIGRESLPQGLAAIGATVEQVSAYKTVAPEGASERIQEALSKGIDVATFTSSSTVRNLTAMLDGKLDRLEGVTIACVGPITADAAVQAGLNVDVTATQYTLAGLVGALNEYFARKESDHE